MGTPAETPRGQGRFQFTLGRMLVWVMVAAVICFIIRNSYLLAAVMAFLTLTIMIGGALSVSGASASIWRDFWSTWEVRVFLNAVFLVIAIAFSPLLLFCVDWERLFAKLRDWWTEPVSSDRAGPP